MELVPCFVDNFIFELDLFFLKMAKSPLIQIGIIGFLQEMSIGHFKMGPSWRLLKQIKVPSTSAKHFPYQELMHLYEC